MNLRINVDELIDSLEPNDAILVKKYWDKNDFLSIKDIVDSTLSIIARDRLKDKPTKYSVLDMNKIQLLKVYIDEYISNIKITDTNYEDELDYYNIDLLDKDLETYGEIY